MKKRQVFVTVLDGFDYNKKTATSLGLPFIYLH